MAIFYLFYVSLLKPLYWIYLWVLILCGIYLFASHFRRATEELRKSWIRCLFCCCQNWGKGIRNENYRDVILILLLSEILRFLKINPNKVCSCVRLSSREHNVSFHPKMLETLNYVLLHLDLEEIWMNGKINVWEAQKLSLFLSFSQQPKGTIGFLIEHIFFLFIYFFFKEAYFNCWELGMDVLSVSFECKP